MENNTRTDFKAVGWERVEYIYLAKDKARGWLLYKRREKNIRNLLAAGNFLTNVGTVSFSRRTLSHGVR
jgi:hypothetical protein